MEDLNSQQIVLLTLLVSFVTSIATGITTVSLLEQAPDPVTQTINRVIEKTVERVVEVDNDSGEPQEKIVETVIVKEEDLTIDAVEKNSNSIVRIFKISNEVEVFVGIGLIVADSAEVLSSSLFLDDTDLYIGSYPDGQKFNLDITSKGEKYSLLNIPEEQGIPSGFSKVSIGNSQNLKLGQSVIALTGQDSNVVSTGIITSFEKQDQSEIDENGEEVIMTKISNIDTSVNSNKIVPGSILLNLQGSIVGFKGGNAESLTTFTPSSEIRNYLDSFGEGE